MTDIPFPLHARRTIRLFGYDYGQPGAYFVTVCTYQRVCLFGEVTGDVMHRHAARRPYRDVGAVAIRCTKASHAASATTRPAMGDHATQGSRNHSGLSKNGRIRAMSRPEP